MSSNWTRPTDLDFPLTARGLEDINVMFQKLFSKFPLGLPRGGTGLGTDDFISGALLYSDLETDGVTPKISLLPDVSAGSYLRSGGLLTAPLWSTLKLPDAAAVGDILIGSTLNTITGLAIGAVGTIVRSNGTIPAYTSFTIPNTFATGNLVYASATNVLSGLATASTGQILRWSGTLPTWTTMTYPNQAAAGGIFIATFTDTMGLLAIDPVGRILRSTGTAPAYTLFTLPNTFAAGDLLHGSATNVVTALAIGAVGKIIRSTGTLPAYSTFTIPDTYAAGDIIYASATNVLTALAKDTNATRYLSNTGASNIPAWAQVNLTNGVTGVLPAANGGSGILFDHFADASVGGAEADIYSDTLAANTFSANGVKVLAQYGGNFVTVGTELTDLRVYLAGTAIWDSTGVAPTTGTTSWRVYVELIRVSSTVVRYTVSLNTTGASGYVYATVGELTGLTLSNTNILKITGASSGVGSGAGDIVGKMGYVWSKPAA